MPDREYKIGPVPGRLQSWALGFLAGGGRDDPSTQQRAHALERMVCSRPPQAVRLWWARRRRRCRAVAMIIESPGKTGMLYHCPAAGPRTSTEALIELIAALSREALASGMSLVQSLAAPAAKAGIAAMRSAGYDPLAELIYMKLDLAQPTESKIDDSLSWRSYGQFNDEELGRVIAATYEDSCDCPKLRRKRPMDQIIAGHKASGMFVPQSWWIVDRDGVPAGCVLVNESTDIESAELVYLGVVKASRGLGLGRKMIQRVAADAYLRGRRALTLAVDSRNTYAKRTYDLEGFREVDRRMAHVMFRHQAENAPR